MLMTGYKVHIINVKDVFLLRWFDKREELHFKIPDGFENYISKNEIIKLNVPIYGLKQAT